MSPLLVCRRPAVSMMAMSMPVACGALDGLEGDGWRGPGPAAPGARSPLPRAPPRSRAARRPPRGTCPPRRRRPCGRSCVQELRELPDRGRLADAVDSDDEHHGGARGEVQGAGRASARRSSRVSRSIRLRSAGGSVVRYFATLPRSSSTIESVRSGPKSARDQSILEVVPRLVVDRLAPEHPAQRAAQRPCLSHAPRVGGAALPWPHDRPGCPGPPRRARGEGGRAVHTGGCRRAGPSRGHRRLGARRGEAAVPRRGTARVPSAGSSNSTDRASSRRRTGSTRWSTAPGDNSAEALLQPRFIGPNGKRLG